MGEDIRHPKIVFVIPFLGNGGAERVVSIWINKLFEKKLNVVLLVFYRIQKEYHVNENIPIISLYNDEASYRRDSILNRILKLRKIFKYEIKDSIILPFISYVGVYCMISSSMTSNIIIETIRNNPWEIPNNRLLKILRDISIKKSKGCIFQTSDQMEYFSQKIRDKSIEIMNPINSELFKIKHKYRENIINIISIGRLTTQKNQEFQIKAMKKLVSIYPNLILRIYGDGENKEFLQKEIKRLKLENNVFLMGKSDMIIKCLNESDLFILTSNYEGLPNALIEAMSIGLPCISSDCKTGPSVLIDENIDGYLYNCFDMEEFICKVKYMIENPHEAKRIGKNAKEKIKYLNKTNNEDVLISYLSRVK